MEGCFKSHQTNLFLLLLNKITVFTESSGLPTLFFFTPMNAPWQIPSRCWHISFPWKEKYQSTDNTENGKRKGKLLPKNEGISGGKAHTNIWKLN